MDSYKKDNEFDFDDDVTYQSYSTNTNGKKKIPLSTVILAILLIVVILLVIIVVRNSIKDDTNDKTTTTTTQVTTTLPQNFTTIEMTQEDIHSGELVLINGSHYYEYDSKQGLQNLYEVKTSSYYLVNTNVRVNKNIWPEINAMFDDFYAATGKRTINIIGAFRSHTDQMHLFNSAVENYGSEAEALKHVQKPGYSEHESGLSIDLQIWDSEKEVVYSFTGEGEYKWLVDNAYKYGFIQRYPEGKTSITGVSTELNHFRYIGIAHATAMKKNNASCFETYIEFLHNYTFEGDHLHVECDNGEKYEIYFSDSLTVYVPTDREYTISGNNVDGFIVTIKN